MRFLSGAIALLAAALLVRPAPSVASGVAETISLFESHLHPDLPLDQFVAGRLGLIKATWSPAFRFVAYRYLAGPGFSASEQKVLVAMMNDRLGLVPPGTAVPKDGYEPTRLPGVLNPTGYDVDAAVAAWLAARNGLPGIDAIEFIDPFRPTPSAIWSFLNCNDSTFRAATTTLSEMIGKFGAESPEVQRWVAAQDQVLNNCSEKPQYPVSYSGEWSKMVDEWTAARNKIPGISAEPSFSGQCPGAAFHSAAAAVDEKIRNLTGSSPQVRRWTETLNRALAECSDSEQPNRLSDSVCEFL